MLDAASENYRKPQLLELHNDADKKNRVGIIIFIGSETVFFLLLILSYVYYRGVNANGPNAKAVLDPLVTGIYSLCLFSSSFTVWRADVNLKRGKQRWLVGWLVATVLLGAVFLFGQGQEYLKLIDKNVTVDRNVFGTSFFTLTGFHGLHVLIGLVLLTTLAVFAALGDFKHGKSSAMTVISYYWHFVDGVWVVIFSIIYLSVVFS